MDSEEEGFVLVEGLAEAGFESVVDSELVVDSGLVVGLEEVGFELMWGLVVGGSEMVVDLKEGFVLVVGLAVAGSAWGVDFVLVVDLEEVDCAEGVDLVAEDWEGVGLETALTDKSFIHFCNCNWVLSHIVAIEGNLLHTLGEAKARNSQVFPILYVCAV